MPKTQFRSTLAATLLALGLCSAGCSQGSANASNNTSATDVEAVPTGAPAKKKAEDKKVVLLNVFGMT